MVYIKCSGGCQYVVKNAVERLSAGLGAVSDGKPLHGHRS